VPLCVRPWNGSQLTETAYEYRRHCWIWTCTPWCAYRHYSGLRCSNRERRGATGFDRCSCFATPVLSTPALPTLAISAPPADRPQKARWMRLMEDLRELGAARGGAKTVANNRDRWKKLVAQCLARCRSK